MRKQQSITRLFPDFGDKVQGIANKGGLRMTRMEPDTWRFKVHSGTKDDVWYDNVIHFKNIRDMLSKYVQNKRLWTRDGQHTNLLKLSKEVLNHVDLQLYCSCPAFKYWGSDYITSLDRYDAKFGEPERRPPNIRNPKQYGILCKHLHSLMNTLPWYNTTLATFLRDYYTEEIRNFEELIKQQSGQGEQELARREELQAQEQPEEIEPTQEETPWHRQEWMKEE